jgi:hypothetical protein
MADVVEIVVKATDQSSGVLKGIGSAMTGLNSAVELVQKAYAAYDKTIGEAMRETVSYADEVRRLSQITGASAQQTSRLIQTADDLKISTEALTAAQRRLSKDGISLTTEQLARLSDEYLAIGNAADRARFLQEKFGRGGFQFAEAMKQGGDVIRKMADSQADNLILTAKQVDQAREYEKAVDAAEDAWAGVKYQIGNAVLPATTELINRMTGNEGLDAAIKRINAGLSQSNRYGAQDTARASMEALKNTPEYIEAAERALEDFRNEERSASDSGQDLLMTEEELAEQAATLAQEQAVAAQAVQDSNAAFLSNVETLISTQQSIDGYNAKQEEIRQKQDDVANAINNAIAMGYSPMGQKVTELQRQYQALSEELMTNSQAFLDNAEAIALANMQKAAASEASANGTEITEEEQQAINDFAVATGQWTQQAANLATAQDLMAEALLEGTMTAEQFEKVMDAIMALPPDKKLTVQMVMDIVNQTGTTSSSSGGTVDEGAPDAGAQAAGGPLRAGQWTLVGDKPGGIPTAYSELISPSGYVYNAKQTRALLSSGRIGRIRALPTGGQINGTAGSPFHAATVLDWLNQTGGTSYGSIGEAQAAYAASLGGTPATTNDVAATVTPVVNVAQQSAAAAQASAQATQQLATQLAQQGAQQTASLDALLTATLQLQQDIYTAVRDGVQIGGA